jgi:hypothetical protein
VTSQVTNFFQLAILPAFYGNGQSKFHFFKFFKPSFVQKEWETSLHTITQQKYTTINVTAQSVSWKAVAIDGSVEPGISGSLWKHFNRQFISSSTTPTSLSTLFEKSWGLSIVIEVSGRGSGSVKGQK